MGRSRKLTPTTREHRGHVYARWTTDRGRQELSLGPADEPEKWKAAFARLLAKLAVDPEATARVQSDLLVPEMLRQWVRSDDAAHLKKLTDQRRTIAVIEEFFADKPASEIVAADLDDWCNALARKRRDDGRQWYSISTIRKMLGIVKRAFRWACRRGLIPADRWHEVDTVTGPNPGLARRAAVREPANPADVEKILPHLRPPVRAMVELQRITGARPSELYRMRPCEVLRSGRVNVDGVGLVDLDSLGVWVYVPPIRKTVRRWIVFGLQAREVLQPFLDRRPPNEPVFDPREAMRDRLEESRQKRVASGGGSGGSRKPKKETPERHPGNEYTAESYRRAVVRACKRAGVPVLTPYQIRHLFAETTRDEHDMDRAQAAMGHDDPRTTQRYAKRSFRLAVEVATASG
jgi:integrase